MNDDNAKSKPCGVFGSYGWSGEAIDILETRLKDTGFSLAFPSIRSKFRVSICFESKNEVLSANKNRKLGTEVFVFRTSVFLIQYLP